ncbi:MAG TPA: alpha/beta hydrolase [Dehalococcoidia bacterium]|nr:alpha/beta hydrolase [Dehalococcoidia bacterium]
MDLSFLDRPEILEVIFPVAYSPFGLPDFLQGQPGNVPTYAIEVEDGVSIRCGFWVAGKERPSILYFHGNGETVASHEWIAPLYIQKGINLFVSTYRGYSSSDGKPTISNMIADTHPIFQGFKEIISREGFVNSIFVMGRSLGSVPAIELAYNYQEEIRGLIVESGSANNFRRLRDYAGITEGTTIDDKSPLLNRVKVRQITKPTLIIHGEYDQVMPVTEGKELYQSSGAEDKRILIIPGADHNDLMVMGQRAYFDAIEGFVNTNR